MKITNRIVWMVKSVLPFYLLALLPLSATAQDGVRRGNCLSSAAETGEAASARSEAQHRLATINNQWDSNKTYRQLVILFSFSDTDFMSADAKALYDSIFNVNGYNQGEGPGCVADYFRDQSGGMCNLQFDVFGPYKVDSKAQPYDNPSSYTTNFGTEPMKEATMKFLEENKNLDFSVYDWNNNGNVNQVVYVHAGCSGNESSTKSYGHIWPNTSSFGAITTADGKRISSYTISAELWVNNASAGIGTICHEYSHSLGLPDIYPTNGWVFSAVDEWDLMDGGNFTNRGWCPPNYSALERMLMGWLTPIELTEPTTITGMKSVADNGNVYMVKHTDTEYLLLENKQWKGWDKGIPGRGLTIYHVNYDVSRWKNNTPNNVTNRLNYDLVHADGLDYEAWAQLLDERGATTTSKIYQNSNRMNSRILSTSPYPWTTDSTETVNNQLTDTSMSAVTMYNKNSSGSYQLAKPITDISMSEEGVVTFRFMGGTPGDGIEQHTVAGTQSTGYYDLGGRRQHSTRAKGLYLERRSDGSLRKVIK